MLAMEENVVVWNNSIGGFPHTPQYLIYAFFSSSTGRKYVLTLQPPLFFSTRAASTELLFLLLDCLFWLEEFVCPRVERVTAELVGCGTVGGGAEKGWGNRRTPMQAAKQSN